MAVEGLTESRAANEPEVLHKFKERQVFAQRLLEEANRLRSEEKIIGMQRIEKQIKAEMEMLEKLIIGSQIIKDHHVKSTNLLHLEGVIHIIKNTHFMLSQSKGSLTAVERFFKFTDSTGIVQNTMVDVVCNGGANWIKVFARRRQALHKKWLGDCNFGEKSVSDFAEDYVNASEQNHYNFSPPSIYFVFFDGITDSISASLKKMNITVVGPTYPDDSTEEAPSPLQIAAMLGSMSSEQPLTVPLAIESKCSLINMDVSSMLAWVSSITHSDSTVMHYHDSVLAEQARQERKDPLWPMLQKATEGKSLLACKTAIDDFKSILSVVAGPSEKQRAKELLSRINVVPDQPSERAQNLHTSGRIKERAKIIFGTGDSLQAITLTANEGFVRAAAGRGISFNVIVHPCRALAELDYKHSVKTDGRRETEADIMPTVLPS